MKTEMKNAKIKSTSLGGYDGGSTMLTCWLHLEYESGGQGFGGYCLDTPIRDENDNFLRREGSAYGAEFIARILDTVGVDRWEDLPGKHIRVKSEHNKVHAIGHIIKDKWFNPVADLAHMADD
jgi:hypothetical protein